MQTRSLRGYLVEIKEWMLKATWEQKVIVGTTESLEEYNKSLYESRVRDWKDKPLHSDCQGYRTNFCSRILEMASQWIFKERNRRNDLRSSTTGPETQFSQVLDRQD